MTASVDDVSSTAASLHKLALTLPELERSAQRTLDEAPGLLLQIDESFRQLQRLIEAMQHNWLLSGSMDRSAPAPIPELPPIAWGPTDEHFQGVERLISWTLLGAMTLYSGGCGSSGSRPRVPQDDVQFSQSASAGMIAFERGDVTGAVKLYERALQRAAAMDDAASIANSAYNLAACEMALSRYDAASRHLAEAQYNSVKSGSGRDEIRLLMAKVAYLQERDGEAESIALSLSNSNSSLVRLQAQILLTAVACDLKQSALAQSRLASLGTMASTTPNLNPSIAAEVEKARGGVANLLGHAHEAAEHFDQETVLLRASHRYREIVHSLSRSAVAHAQAGESDLAADRYYRAARGCLALEDPSRAKLLADQAMLSAKAAHDTELVRVTEILINEIPAEADPSGDKSTLPPH